MLSVTRYAAIGAAVLAMSVSSAHSATVSILEDNGRDGISATFDLDERGFPFVLTQSRWFLGILGRGGSIRFSNFRGEASTILFDANSDHMDLSTVRASTGNVEPAPISFFYDSATRSGGFSFGNAIAPVNPAAISAVPLPTSALLLLGAIGGLMVARTRKMS